MTFAKIFHSSAHIFFLAQFVIILSRIGFDWSDLYSSQNMDDAINIIYTTVNRF